MPVPSHCSGFFIPKTAESYSKVKAIMWGLPAYSDSAGERKGAEVKC